MEAGEQDQYILSFTCIHRGHGAGVFLRWRPVADDPAASQDAKARTFHAWQFLCAHRDHPFWLLPCYGWTLGTAVGFPLRLYRDENLSHSSVEGRSEEHTSELQS